MLYILVKNRFPWIYLSASLFWPIYNSFWCCHVFYMYFLNVKHCCFFLQSDIWAMGVCVYEMTTLKRPFNAHRMQQLIFEIVHGQVRSIDVKLVDGAII